ncbi:MAG TPA: universal stress protein [Kofleriaceae bacterium]|nr:universal stress protein [Kofleriaceae bacterium]
MSSTTSQVVVGFDFTHSGREALYRAIALATRAPFHVLHFVCVIDPHSAIPALPTHAIDYAYADRVQRAIADEVELELRARPTSVRIHFNVHARIGKAADEILSVARDVGADLIIVGSKGLTGARRLVLGSVSEKVVREAGCTVEVARAKSYDHVDLLEVTEVESHHHFIEPHRYYYEENRLSFRPDDWPLP